jgi:hypothetical protein
MDNRRIYKTIIVVLFIIICTIGISLFILHIKAANSPAWFKAEQNLYTTVKYYYRCFIPTAGWIESDDLDDLWRYLKNEKVENITFCWIDYNNSPPEKWWTWGEITEPERINQTLQLLYASKIEGIIPSICDGRMKIITDKHKFLMPIDWQSDVVYSYRWESRELRKQLWKWGFPDSNGAVQEYKYFLPTKEQTVAVLLYHRMISPPLAIFGDKKLAEKLVFEPNVRDDPNGIKGIAGLYKAAQLRMFGVQSRKENGKIITSNELKPNKVFEGRDWIEKIMDAYDVALKEAEEREKYFPMKLNNSVGRIVFMTQDGNYWKQIGIDSNTVYDDYIKSAQVKAYFDELGLTKELLAGKTAIAESNDANTTATEQ